IESGVFAGMLDFGELNFVPNPDRAFFPSFSTPRRSVTELHNLFGLAYTEGLVARASKLTGLRKIGMSRPGTAGSQR
ncbi:hypothetical protein, partial [Stenotrophomonas maltophilia]|uniref:hypothetical protein n=1 Tax=Stenotrophomonas maltophilia TaxID=40324 RepID=UPI0013DB3807